MAKKSKNTSKIIPAEDEALMSRMANMGIRPRKVEFPKGIERFFYLSARGIRLAEKQGVGVIDPVMEAAQQAVPIAIANSVIEEARKEGREITAEMNATLHRAVEQALAHLSFDKLVTTMSAALYAGLVPLYPSVTLDDIDMLMSPTEAKRVQKQILDDLLSIVKMGQESAAEAAADKDAEGASADDGGPAGN